MSERVAIAETEIKEIKKDLKQIKTIDLPKLHKGVNDINTNFKIYKAKTAVWVGIAIFIATFLAQIAIKMFIK